MCDLTMYSVEDCSTCDPDCAGDFRNGCCIYGCVSGQIACSRYPEGDIIETSDPQHPLLHLSGGGLTMRIVNLGLRGHIHLSGTSLEMHNCTFTQPSLLSGRFVRHASLGALRISAGRAELHGVKFTKLLSGALVVDGGTTVITNCEFSFNSANNGTAALVRSGVLTLAGSLIEHNRASGAGGALAVEGGSVLLTGTVLRNNSAPSGGMLFLASGPGSVTYGLPAPLGHWITTTFLCTDTAPVECDWALNPLVRGLTVTKFDGNFDSDFPYACSLGIPHHRHAAPLAPAQHQTVPYPPAHARRRAPSQPPHPTPTPSNQPPNLGTYGNSFDTFEQSQPGCSARCAAGRYQDKSGATACSGCKQGYCAPAPVESAAFPPNLRHYPIILSGHSALLFQVGSVSVHVRWRARAGQGHTTQSPNERCAETVSLAPTREKRRRRSARTAPLAASVSRVRAQPCRAPQAHGPVRRF